VLRVAPEPTGSGQREYMFGEQQKYSD
jgi:hypothetical protein